MREILFRGKTQNGEWVYGDFWETKYNENSTRPKLFYIREKSYLWERKEYEVIPETVGQFTGLTDKHGKKIFEGDIAIVGRIRYIVAFKGAEWKFSHISGQPYCYPFFASHAKDSEVIGNIHDNPELLEVNQ